MEFVLPKISDVSEDSFAAAFGISKEREEEIEKDINDMMQSLPQEDKKNVTRSKLVRIFVSHAKNIEEVSFLSCQADYVFEMNSNPIARMLKGLEHEGE